MTLLKKPKKVQSLTDRVAVISRFVLKATDRCLPFFDVLKGSKRFEWNEVCEQAFNNLKKHLGTPPLLSKQIHGEPLFMYLAVSNHSLSVALIREEDHIQLHVYYVSKRLLDAETRYTNMKKLALALVVASRKLCPYFHSHTIKVLTNYPL